MISVKRCSQFGKIFHVISSLLTTALEHKTKNMKPNRWCRCFSQILSMPREGWAALIKSLLTLGGAPHRPSDLGNFLDGRLQDAENDSHGPPQYCYLDYDYEGQGSVVDDYCSLRSRTSDGSQQYDHLQNLGPKFRPLHDLYNHQSNV